MEFQMSEYTLLFFMVQCSFIIQVYIMYYLINFKIVMRFNRYSCIILLLFLLLGCGVQKAYTPIEMYDFQDARVSVYMKIAWSSDLCFYVKNNSVYEVHCYHIFFSRKTNKVSVHYYERYPTIEYLEELLEDSLTAQEFKQFYGHDDYYYKKILLQIDSSFTELSNDEKIRALDSYIQKQQ